MPAGEAVAGLAVASLVGLAVGIEREWSGHASGPGARFAGARTFLLLGATGGVAGLLFLGGSSAAAAVLLGAAGALTVAAYAVAARQGGVEAVDGTTEAAALVVVGLGVLAVLGQRELAAGMGAVVVLVLREKGAIHAFVRRLDQVELRAALQFAVLALVCLPILPVGPYGPLGGVRPRELWLVVLLVSGLNFAAYLARRTLGGRGGVVVAGMMGGAISSTAVSLSFARRSRTEPGESSVLALGVIGACTVLMPRLVIVTAVLRPELTRAALPILLPGLAVGLGLLYAGWRRGLGDGPAAEDDQPRNPLQLGSAILLAIGFQAVLMVMAVVRERFGSGGVVASAALLGLTDMDALALSLSHLAAQQDMLASAAVALGVGVVSNTVLKLCAVLLLGAGSFRWKAGAGLGLLLAAVLAGLWLGPA